MSNTDLRNYGIIFLIAIILYLPNLGGSVLWDVDEAEFADCAAEMLRANEWIVPTLNGEVYATKPILMFWFMMVSFAIFGVNEFAARLPGLVFAIATLFLTYKIGTFFFNRQVGFWAAVAMSASLMFSIQARGALPDAPLTFFVTLAMYLWACGTFHRCDNPNKSQPNKSRNETQCNDGVPLQLRVEDRYYPNELWRIAIIYLVMGVGVLMKGPLACVVPTAIIGMFLLIKRLPGLPDLPIPQHLFGKCVRFFYLLLRPFHPVHFFKTVWLMRPITAILAISIVALPWYLLVGWKTGWFTPGGYLHEFFVYNNFQRATQPLDGRSDWFYNPLFFYPLSLLLGFFPWSMFAIPAVLESVKHLQAKTPQARTQWNDGLIFMFCWALVWIGCFSVATTKLPSYIIPMYPAFALLIGIYISNWIEGKTLVTGRWNRIAFIIGICAGILMTIVGSLSVMFLISTEEIFIPIILGLILLIGCTYCMFLLKSASPVKTLACFVVVAMFFTGFLHVVGATRISAYHPAREIGAAVRERQAEVENGLIRVVSFNRFRQSWAFYSGRPFERTGGTAEELSTLLEQERPEVVIAPASLAEGIMTPPEYRQQIFHDFRLPKRPQVMMFIRE